MEIAGYLKNNHTIDFRNIYETSKKLKTLSDPLKKLAMEYFDEDYAEMSAEEEFDSDD